ncbi:hypothetical protein Tco_0951434 [Tanacetum coccineum]|uniref:Uncharacterized protein n=1 Tax=Tanacetum coccineum TaxID=301880 RepID=A0ABQ5E057_9ASTR
MRIPAWMITDEMKLTEHYKMYAEVFGLDVPLTQSQPTESTQGTHRTPSAPRSPNPATETAESKKTDEMILQDMIQVSLTEHKSREEQEAGENVALLEPRVKRKVGGGDCSGEKGGRDYKGHGGRYGYLFAHLKKRFMPRTSSDQLADNLHDVMMETLPSLVKEKVTEQVKKEVPAQVRDQHSNLDDPHDDAHPEGENSAKRQKTSEYEAYVSGESSSGQVNVEEPGPSTLGNQEQDDEFDFWTDSYASDDDEIPTKQVTQDIMEEISLTIDEAKLKKMADEMLRQRCTSGDEHQYHIDQMKNFLQSDIVWESRKEILVSPHPRKITPLVQSCQRDPEAPALSLINQDLLYLKKGNSGPEKIVLSLHKFPAIVFNDDDIEERTSRWVNKCIKKFNPYARYGLYQCSSGQPITFPGIEEYDVFSIVYEPVHGIIYTNSKKEKRVMRHSEIHKFCDATLRRTLEGLKSYYNDVKYGYVQKELTNDEVEFLKLFEEEIEVRLNYRDQMRRWEMYVNGRPLGPRRERPE